MRAQKGGGPQSRVFALFGCQLSRRIAAFCHTVGSPAPSSLPSPLLSSLQAALLRMFDVKQAAFKMKLLAVWQNDEVEQIAEDGSDEEEEEGEEGGSDFEEADPLAGMELPASLR